MGLVFNRNRPSVTALLARAFKKQRPQVLHRKGGFYSVSVLLSIGQRTMRFLMTKNGTKHILVDGFSHRGRKTPKYFKQEAFDDRFYRGGADGTGTREGVGPFGPFSSG